jgi:pimeloyl-ACP methyl ester carboxylesterase/PKD repeat protein
MKHFLTIFSFLFLYIGFASAQILIPATPMPRPADFEYLAAPDSNGYRMPLRMPDTSMANKTMAVVPKIPYPIILVHGLLSNDQTWDTYVNYLIGQHGFTYGGRFDYCLNYDDDNSYANTIFAPNQWADLKVFNGTWQAGDVYVINFDVGDNGSVHPSTFSSSYVKSNQSAIVKQGKALQDAIARVLQLTGREKVVLLGHSMGGLASREYAQNTYNWQSTGYHHVAKVATTGTPHGGSNTTTVGLIYGPDGQTEAVRDLRRSYSDSGNPGVFLFGGIESLSYMDDHLTPLVYFYNSDVNCDGSGSSTGNILGLNQKGIYTSIDYAFIVGDCSGCVLDGAFSGDGVVNIYSSNLNNFYPGLNADHFIFSTSAITEIHTDLPKQIYKNMQVIDESDDLIHAFHVGLDTSYLGFITDQAQSNPNYPVDFDTYQFEVTTAGDYSVSISNINNPDLYVEFVDTLQNIIGSVSNSNGATTLFNKATLNPGKYFVVIYGLPSVPQNLDSYEFILTQCPQVTFTASQTILCAGSSSVYTGSLISGSSSFVNWSFPGGSPSTSNQVNLSVSYASAGTWPVTLIATNQCGSDTLTINGFVSVQPVPSAPGIIKLPNTNAICQGETASATFGNGSGGVGCMDEYYYRIDGGPYNWYIPGSLIGTTASSSVMIESRRVNCTPGIGCNNVSSQVTWAVNPIPAPPSVTQSGNILTSSASIGNQWYLNGNLLPGETGLSLNCALYGNGSYAVRRTDNNGCTSALSASIYVTLTALEKDSGTSGIILYPNPTEGMLNIQTSGNWSDQELHIQVFDVNGRIVQQFDLRPSPKANMNLKDLPSGMYSFRIVDSSGEILYRSVVIQ